MPPPELIDDAVAEILLRLPPDDPACLVCKPWRRIASSPTFLRRYRRFHRSPPPLSFIAGSYFLDPTPCFVPTTDTASPFRHAVSHCRGYFPLDCRHGRLLLKKPETDHFLVWDPVTGDRNYVPEPPIVWFAAAVCCTAAGCDHRDFHGSGGSYLVLCMGTDNMLPIVHACVYSSRSASWGALVSVHIGASYVTPARGTLVRDAMYMYFVLGLHNKILKYNFAEHCLSVIHPPEVYDKGIVLMVTEDGLLGLSGIRDFNLYLWSREADAEGVEWWVQTRMIDLQSRLLPVANPFKRVERAVVTGFAEGACVIFVSTDIGGFVIELKTGRDGG
ncbi:unnamed protein product [Urochloa decumbens]|uniref:F-box protein AT5G49610-like beta-propeller domain-containing protein n=1 Tax=Urochloa decumbens TaxID=240449 RepID=A0ABC9FLQ4_9POAL